MKRVQTSDFWEAQDAPGLRPGAPIGQFELGGGSRNFIYIIRDQGGSSLLIDTQVGMTSLWEEIESQGGKVVGVALTHTHWDHVPGLHEIAERTSGLPLYVHPLELHRIEKEAYFRKFNLQEIKEGDEIPFGTGKLQTIHTPGHSAGGCSFFFDSEDPACFTGDTLFLGDCGRTDLPTGDDAEMFSSLARLKKLPPETRIFPGHHYRREISALLRDELRSNRALLCKSMEELRALP